MSDGDYIKSESIGLSRLLDRIRETGARTTLAIVDACRENPFKSATGRGIGGARGLGRIAAPEGTFVIFSAGAGQLALDRLSDSDADRNSVFARALLPRLTEPDLELREMVAEVRRDVRDLAAKVGTQQFPSYYDELLGDFYLASTAPTAQPVPDTDPIRRDYEFALSAGTREALRAFLDRYADRSDSFVVSLAHQRLAALEPPALVPAPTPEAAPQPEPDTRALLRETQAELNRLGCNAGQPDGVAGPRTRAAFARFLAESGTRGLDAGDLGSAPALAALKNRSSRVCTPAVTATAPPPQTPQRSQPTAGVIDMTGSWAFRSTCTFFIKTTGTYSWHRSGDGYVIDWTDSLGQGGRMTARMTDRAFRATGTLKGIPFTFTGIVDLTGKTISGEHSLGCRITARRT